MNDKSSKSQVKKEAITHQSSSNKTFKKRKKKKRNLCPSKWEKMTSYIKGVKEMVDQFFES